LCEKCGIWSAMKIKVNMNSVNNLFQASEGKKCGEKKSNLGQVQNDSVCISESISLTRSV